METPHRDVILTFMGKLATITVDVKARDICFEQRWVTSLKNVRRSVIYGVCAARQQKHSREVIVWQ